MSIYEINIKKRNGEEISLSEFKEKVLLIVNTATGCGFTPQYEAIENLYEKYHNQGFEVLDFPCDQFGHQAPGTDDEIHEFCTAKYKTQFDQFAKVEVNGENEAPIFSYIKKKAPYKPMKGLKNTITMKSLEKLSGTSNTDDIRWNFTKFLVDKKGNVINRYEPMVDPKDIEEDIKKLL